MNMILEIRLNSSLLNFKRMLRLYSEIVTDLKSEYPNQSKGAMEKWNQYSTLINAVVNQCKNLHSEDTQLARNLIQNYIIQLKEEEQ